MYDLFYELLTEFGIGASASLLAYVLSLMAIGLICVFARAIFGAILWRVSKRAADKSSNPWVVALHDHKLFQRLAYVAPIVIITLFATDMPQYGGLLGRISGVFVVASFLLLFDSLIKSVDQVYQRHEVSKTRPIKSLLQVVEIAVVAVGSIVAIASLTGTSVSVLLGGIGAMTAVTSLIFKDAILGFVAGIQLITNDMIHIGDWITVPNYSADGTVIELLMTTVKVQNADKTITTIPAYALISDAFINWRGMENTGARRFMRALVIDADSVRVCDTALLERLRGIDLLRPYIEEKAGAGSAADTSLPDPTSDRSLTNLGLLRMYMNLYLKQHPQIRTDLTCLVRQKAQGEMGIPLEVVAFTDTVQWAEYEGIQADIFDHFFVMVPVFDLRLYQAVTGSDMQQLSAAK